MTRHLSIALLLLSCIVAESAVPSFRYRYRPPYNWTARNTDQVNVGGYQPAVTGVGTLGAISNARRDWLADSPQGRIRQSGTVTGVKIYLASVATITELRITFWRKIAVSNWNLVGTTEDIRPVCSALITNTITLAVPVTGIQEGDYYGIILKGSPNPATPFVTANVTGAHQRYVTDPSPDPGNGYDWESKSTVDGKLIPVNCLMTAPAIVSFGDSIIAGHGANYSFCETTATSDLTVPISYHLTQITGSVMQNMGVGGQTMTTLSARRVVDIVNLKPKSAILEGGLNDLIAGYDAAAFNTFKTKWGEILTSCQGASIKPIVLLILPYSNGTTALMQARDVWNAWLASVTTGYGGMVVDASSYVGQFRAGGDAGNLWDIQPAYLYADGSGGHYNSAGHTKIAQAIYDACK